MVQVQARVVYLAGLVQGIALVTFPAASTVFTDSSEYNLSRAMVTIGRVAFAAGQRWVTPRLTYHVLPFVLGRSPS